jgi:hypothetical protein
MNEACDLLLEINEKTNELLTIQDCGLKNNDVLLFEEGFLPLKGQLKFQVFLFLLL